MLRVLVIFHLYYKDQLDYFIDKLKNISNCHWDLLVTGPDLDEESKKSILSFKADASFLETENVGFDLWPFIAAVKSVNLDEYDILVKIHTKNSNKKINHINGMSLKGFLWRNMLVNALLYCPAVFQSVLNKFDDPSVGAVCCKSLYKDVSAGLYEDLSPLDKELSRLGIEAHDKHFCAGTMFAARTAPYKILQTDLVTSDIFTEGVSHSTGSMGHIYERVIFILVTAAGYKAQTISLNRKQDIGVSIHKIISPILSRIFAISRKGEKRHKYLTIFGMDFKIAN